MAWKSGLWGRNSTHLSKKLKLTPKPRLLRVAGEMIWENDKRPGFWPILAKVPPNWVKAHILDNSESTCNGHVKQYWCETNENFWENYQRPEYGIILEPRMASDAYILYTSNNIVTISIWNNTSVKPVEIFLIIWSKSPTLGLCDPIAHISQSSSSNEHIKQDWSESRATF